MAKATERKIESCSIGMGKLDSRCMGWTFIIRAKDAVPAPEDVGGAGDFGKAYAYRGGEEELFEGDVLLLGEALHHRKLRGWMHRMYLLDTREGSPRNRFVEIDPNSEMKKKIKALMLSGRCTMPADFLKGSGENAAMARIIHALRNGVTLDDLLPAYRAPEQQKAA